MSTFNSDSEGYRYNSSYSINLFMKHIFMAFLFVAAKCGEDVLHAPGVINRADTPSDFDGNQECIWTVSVAVGFQVAVQFEKLEVRRPSACSTLRLRNACY